VLAGSSVFGVTKFGGVVKAKIQQNWRKVSKKVSQINQNSTSSGANSSTSVSKLGAKICVWAWFGVAPTLFWGGVFPLVCVAVWAVAIAGVVGAPLW